MGKKGKKKPSQGDQPAAAPKSEAPSPAAAAGTSGAAGGGQGDQPQTGGKKGKKQSQGSQPVDTDRGQAAASSSAGQGQGDGRRGQETAPQQGAWGGPQQQPPRDVRPAQGDRQAPQQQQAQAPGGGQYQQRGRGQGRGGPQQQQGQQQRPGPGRGQPQQPQHQQGGPGPQQPRQGWGQAQQPPQRGPGPQQQPGPGWGPPQQPPQQYPGPQQPSQGWGQAQQPPQRGPGPQQQPGPGWGSPQQPPQRGPGPQQQPGPGWGPPPQQQPGPGRVQAPQQVQGFPGQRPAAQQQGPPRGGPPGFSAPPPGQMPQAARAPVQGPPAQQRPAQKQAKPPGRAAAPSTSSQIERVTSDVSKMQIKRQDAGDANLVSKVRFKPGTQGRVIMVESNHLQLNLGKIETAYHYDVNIVPDKPKKFLRIVMENFRKKRFPKRWPAFDGMKNLYTSSPLAEDLDTFFEDTVTLDDEGRPREYKVEVKFANKVDMRPLQDFLRSPVTPQEAIQVVDIVLRMAPVQTCLPVGRSFFVRPQQMMDLGEGMEMYQGFYQSAVRGWTPLLNVDVAHKAFPQNINVLDALAQILSNFRQQFTREDLRRPLDPRQEETLSKYIKTLRVTYEIPGHPGSRKSYRVNGLGTAPSRATFVNEGQTMTVQEYFRQKKNYMLRHPDLPTLWVGNQNREDKILLPIELCVIVEGQAINRKMTENQTSKMIRYAATDTATRKNKIVQGIQKANYNQHPSVKEFGFSVGNEFQKLDARVLSPPDLLYNNNKTVRVAKGVWRNESFLNGVTINNWTICATGRYPPRPDDYRKMISMFESCARNVGMHFANKAVEPFKHIDPRQTYREFEQFLKTNKNRFDVIFVIVPDSGPEYSYVKKAAEISVGCLTQCIKSTTVARKMSPQTAVNILLKVNSKLNGINHTFSPQTKPIILNRPIMIMGADVTHPSPDSQNIPSVAAVTASHDPKAFKYNICWRLQNPKAEIIEDLENIVMEQLTFFKSKTNRTPEVILFFRDGVSEGQFDIVKRSEIRAIESACAKMKITLKITFVVVQKRHHTRLFPTNPRDSEDRNCNVPAGTCVDTKITHPFMQDFYLVSHASIQGVAKPTKYCTIYDQNDMTNDDIEQMAFYLCHMFSRCNRSVSYPAPTYYAHLAAARAKVYIENDRLNLDQLQREFARYQIKDEIRKDLPMFFV